MELLIAYKWPGNIRELENVIERIVILNRGPFITTDYIPKEILQGSDDEEDNIIYFPKEGISLEKLEKDLILKALNMADGKQTRAAELLDITRSALIYRMQKHEIKIETRLEDEGK